MTASRFPYVCVNCKIRKKACDKILPSCTYCATRGIVCQYVNPVESTAIVGPSAVNTTTVTDGPAFEVLPTETKAELLLLHSVSDHAYLLPTSGFPRHDRVGPDSVIHRRVQRLLQTTGLTVAEVYERYTHGLNVSLPVVTEEQFISYQNALVSFIAPPADTSLLMLATALLAFDDSRDPRTTQLLNRASLYIAIKMLYAQVQALTSPSLPLVQAGILIAIHEFLTGSHHRAFLSISTCSLVLESCRIGEDFASSPHIQIVRWCCLICQRLMACEIQPVTLRYTPQVNIMHFPASGKSAISGPDGILSSSLNPLNTIAGFTSTIQAACLLDQVIRFEGKPLQMLSHNSTAVTLSQDLQLLLEQLLEADTQTGLGGRCSGASISIVIRAMFMFHKHIVNAVQAMQGDHPDLEQLKARSYAALTFAAQLIADLAHSHAKGEFLANIDSAAPGLISNASIALDLIEADAQGLNHQPESMSRETSIKSLKNLIACLGERWNPGIS